MFYRKKKQNTHDKPQQTNIDWCRKRLRDAQETHLGPAPPFRSTRAGAGDHGAVAGKLAVWTEAQVGKVGTLGASGYFRIGGGKGQRDQRDKEVRLWWGIYLDKDVWCTRTKKWIFATKNPGVHCIHLHSNHIGVETREKSDSTYLTILPKGIWILSASSLKYHIRFKRKKTSAIFSLKLKWHLKMHGWETILSFWAKGPIFCWGKLVVSLARRHGSHTEACSDPPDLVIWEADSLV